MANRIYKVVFDEKHLEFDELGVEFRTIQGFSELLDIRFTNDGDMKHTVKGDDIITEADVNFIIETQLNPDVVKAVRRE